MTKRKGPRYDQFHPMLQRIEQQANAMTANGEEPRKHHLVPRFYLERWSEGGKVRATELASKKSYTPSPINAARRTDFYRFEEGTFRDGSPVWWECFLSVLEGEVSRTFQQVVEGGKELRDLDTPAYGELMWFIALQMTRGVNFRRHLQWHVLQKHVINHDRTGDRYLRSRLESAGREATEERVAVMRRQLQEMKDDPTKLPMLTSVKVMHSAEMAGNAVRYLLRRRAVIYETPARLITSDEPVTALVPFMGANEAPTGWANAPVLVYPLAPDKVLALFQPDHRLPASDDLLLSHEDLLDLNQCILGNSFMHAFERPSQHLTERLFVPELPPAGERSIVGTDANGGQLHKLLPGRRWRNHPDAPTFPVARWWA